MKMHITENYLLNPTHPVTVTLIGCGGTGSQVLTCLARINNSLQAMGHPGLLVMAYDPDIVTEVNIGRQLFSPSEIGLNKAIALVSRLNRFFGSAWDAVPEEYNKQTAVSSNITISCVDNVKARISISKKLAAFTREYKSKYAESYLIPYYWMDFGNTRDSGQVVLGTLLDIKQPKTKKYKTVAHLPTITERFDLTQVDEADSGPSCSQAEALRKQNLFINSSLAQMGCDFIWRLLSEGMIDKAGVYSMLLRTA